MSALINKDRALRDLAAELGVKPLSRFWAKAEIFLGLTGAAAGLSIVIWYAMHGNLTVGFVASSMLLMVFGAYLAMAGHRSLIYQSNNLLTAYLAQEIRQIKESLYGEAQHDTLISVEP